MTNEEAIKRIRDHMEAHKLNEPHAVLINEALEMAIEALETNNNTAYWKDGRCAKCGSLCPPRKISYLGELTFEYNYETNFCTNCGAKMMGIKETAIATVNLGKI